MPQTRLLYLHRPLFNKLQVHRQVHPAILAARPLKALIPPSASSSVLEGLVFKLANLVPL